MIMNMIMIIIINIIYIYILTKPYIVWNKPSKKKTFLVHHQGASMFVSFFKHQKVLKKVVFLTNEDERTLPVQHK